MFQFEISAIGKNVRCIDTKKKKQTKRSRTLINFTSYVFDLWRPVFFIFSSSLNHSNSFLRCVQYFSRFVSFFSLAFNSLYGLLSVTCRSRITKIIIKTGVFSVAPVRLNRADRARVFRNTRFVREFRRKKNRTIDAFEMCTRAASNWSSFDRLKPWFFFLAISVFFFFSSMQRCELP